MPLADEHKAAQAAISRSRKVIAEMVYLSDEPPLPVASVEPARLIRGDTITIEGVFEVSRLQWWKRVLIRLGLRRPPVPPPRSQFVVVE